MKLIQKICIAALMALGTATSPAHAGMWPFGGHDPAPPTPINVLQQLQLQQQQQAQQQFQQQQEGQAQTATGGAVTGNSGSPSAAIIGKYPVNSAYAVPTSTVNPCTVADPAIGLSLDKLSVTGTTGSSSDWECKAHSYGDDPRVHAMMCIRDADHYRDGSYDAAMAWRYWPYACPRDQEKARAELAKSEAPAPVSPPIAGFVPPAAPGRVASAASSAAIATEEAPTSFGERSAEQVANEWRTKTGRYSPQAMHQ